VLATVRGDVHDIARTRRLILTNNGYRVVNLGIKQPIGTILDAVREHRAHAIGMSGLLVKSTVVMRENLEEMTRQGLDVPVDARRRRVDPALCRGGLRQGLCSAASPMPATPSTPRLDGPHRRQRFRRLSQRVQQKNAGKPVNQSRKLGRAGNARRSAQSISKKSASAAPN